MKSLSMMFGGARTEGEFRRWMIKCIEGCPLPRKTEAEWKELQEAWAKDSLMEACNKSEVEFYLKIV